MFRYGFAKEDITPVLGIPLCGYFEPRPNCGVMDPLSVKAAVFECGGKVTGIVSYDLCLIERSLTERFIQALKDAGMDFAEQILFSATHTHTGPYTAPLFDGPMDEDYLDEVVAKTVYAVKKAYRSLAEAELLTGRTECSTLAFNRRFWMKDGSVLTNPGKRNPDIVKPESVIDPEIPLLAVRQNGMLRLLIANITNHTDTIGFDYVSADWPGRMEKEIQHSLGYDLPVMMLTGCQGNINHFNVENDFNQTSYEEAIRIGKGYAAEILLALYAMKKVNVDEIRVDVTEFEAPVVQVTDAEYEEAKSFVEQAGSLKAESADDMTSEGIAKGNAFVKLFFARRLMECRDNPFTGKRMERMIAIKFGKEAGLLSIPGEPFVEIGLALKEASRFPVTMISALSMGCIGYIGMEECYERGGGYETRPARTAPAHDLAPALIRIGTDLLNRG